MPFISLDEKERREERSSGRGVQKALDDVAGSVWQALCADCTTT